WAPAGGRGRIAVGVSARLQHTPGIRQWDPRAENWVPICASIWDPDPRLGPALPAVAISKWEVSEPLVLTVAAWIDPPLSASSRWTVRMLTFTAWSNSPSVI